MRALTISAHGGLEQLEVRHDLPEPEPGPGEVRVRVRAAALNHLDLFVVAGLPGVTMTPPWIMGADAAGVVDSLGPGVDDVRTGDHVVINPGLSCRQCEYCLAGEQPLCPRFRLLGEHAPGTIAEFVVVPAANVRQVPEGLDPIAAAAYPLSTLTAWRMIVSRARVTPGDLVLIWGIGGGVALQAMQIAKNIGARVWVTSGDDAKLERARELGADGTFNHRRDDVAKEVRARTGKRGVDVVVDNVGAATWKQSLLALGRAGRLVTCGATSGPVVETDVRRLFWNQWTIMGSTMGSDAEFDAVIAELRAGRLLPVVDSVYSLEESARAFDRLDAGSQFGKLVIRMGD
ncbi:MAG: zinc-binding dehydrogenase [Gemmatimonadaceae bacterium]